MFVTALALLSATFAAPAVPAAAPAASAASPAASAAAPAAAPRDAAVPDSELAAWVAESLVADARTTAESAEELYARKGRHDDLALASAVSARMLAAGLQGLVVSCSDGTVSLRGRSDTDARRQTAGRLAAAVPGVVAVSNLLRLADEAPPAPRAADASLAATAATAARAAAAAAAGPAQSEPFAFLTADALAGRSIVVSVSDGVVTLNGLVNSEAARSYAAAAAQKVPGVRAVTNTLAVRPHGVEDDRRIALLVQRRLENSATLKDVAPSLQVSVSDGVVHLAGTVRDEAQRAEAQDLVAGTQVVFAVESSLAVDPDVRAADGNTPPRGFRMLRPY